jgi:non-specific serine/threonine protein kinase
MADSDPLRTQRDVSTPVGTELDAAGFEDAEEIGRGRFGVVYRCTQVALDRTVAVKLLTAALDEDNGTRFFREQRTMARLNGHPNIVMVLEAGATASGCPYLVMPYYALGSVDTRLHGEGPLPADAVLRIGVKIAGALESAHRLGIVHRDVKPGNILITDYGEPALTDFGIAPITDRFQTTAGTLTGSSAFTAPEVLSGETPTPAADVFGLGATLFCALTGHTDFERASGENMMTQAQALRITSQPIPDLRDSGIAEDISAVVAAAMSHDPRQRRSAAEFGKAIRHVQRRLGFPVDEMVVYAEPAAFEHQDRRSPPRGRRPPSAGRVGGGGALPSELTSFVDRRTEVSEVKNLLASSRLVTLTGIGGVGKTRLALRVAATARRQSADGVWLVELADVSEPSLLIDVVAATLGLRDDPARPLQDVVVEYLSAKRSALLVLDNCEQLVAAVAELVATCLQACAGLRFLVTSREPLDVAGEAVVWVAPLQVPESDREPSPRGVPRYDAVTLFADRATAAVPGLEFSDDSKTTVARICTRLDGLPLAIELAAARMRTMSPEQILQRLDNRYALLTRGGRTAPTRQQTLRQCIDWSYELCTPAEQRLWARLSVFAGGFELDAAEQICSAGLAPENPLDALSSLVEKSILVRVEANGIVRFRMLETVRDYGRQKLRESGEDQQVRRRHRDWYQQLALAAEAEWISAQQPYWAARLEREQPNLRAALRDSLLEHSEQAAEAGLRTAAALFMFWGYRGLFSEGRRWIDQLLDHPAHQSGADWVKALHIGCVMATLQGDLPAAEALVAAEGSVAEHAPAPMTQAVIAYAHGALALYRGDLALASSQLERVVNILDSDRRDYPYVAALIMLGWVRELEGETKQATECYRQVLAITEATGESLLRSTALWGMGVAAWQLGEQTRATELVENALRVNRQMYSPVIAALSSETLAWVACADGDAERAAVLMGAAQEIWQSVGSIASTLPAVPQLHDESVRAARSALGTRRFDEAVRKGRAMGMDEAVAYALGERLTGTIPAAGSSGELTKRERQVADLIARGFTNKQIAAKLVISQRTAQGHVEHILAKLGFTSRAQIAAWIVEEAGQPS